MEVRYGDGTGWLGCQDSNSETANLKTPFDSSAKFPEISERYGTGDFSPVRCPKLHIDLPAALAAWAPECEPVSGVEFWKPSGQLTPRLVLQDARPLPSSHSLTTLGFGAAMVLSATSIAVNGIREILPYERTSY
jgi:hypothetical protein